MVRLGVAHVREASQGLYRDGYFHRSVQQHQIEVRLTHEPRTQGVARTGKKARARRDDHAILEAHQDPVRGVARQVRRGTAGLWQRRLNATSKRRA
jgi:hypothetical protein